MYFKFVVHLSLFYLSLGFVCSNLLHLFLDFAVCNEKF